MGCFNDPAWKVYGWVGGWVAETNYLYPARWGWIKKETEKCQKAKFKTSQS